MHKLYTNHTSPHEKRTSFDNRHIMILEVGYCYFINDSTMIAILQQRRTNDRV